MNIFQRGYDWAAEALQSRLITPAELEANVECAEDFGEFDDFDRGALAALRDHNKRKEPT